MTIEGMRLLIGVVEAGSLSAAARATGQSPASVSRKIGALEFAVGAKLLNRTSRVIALTTVGTLYHDRSKAILGQIDQLSQAVSEQQSEPRGLLTVHTRVGVASQFLSAALPSFLLRFPDIQLNLLLNEEPPNFEACKLDVAICIGAPADQDLVIRRVSPGLERIAYASPSYLDLHSPIETPADLTHHNCLSIGLLPDGTNQSIWLYRSAAGAKEVRVTGNLVVNDAHTLHMAAITGIGIGLLPAWIVAEDLSFGRVHRVLADYELSQTTLDHGIYASFERSDMMLPKVRVFIDFLADTFRRSELLLARISADTDRGATTKDRRAPDAMRWIHAPSRK